MILITGATGHFGHTAIDFLLQKTHAVNLAALVRDENKAADLKTKGVDVRLGNYDDYDSLIKAMEGIDKVLLISGNDIVNREKQHKNVVDAAKETGVKHIIYTSFERKNESENSPLGLVAKAHMNTDKYIKNSGLVFTILRNSLYADGLPVFFGEKVLETGIYLPAGDGKGSFAIRHEMAEAAANVLAGEGHENKVYNISNTENYSMKDMATILSEVSGKHVRYVSPTREEFQETLSKAGVPEQLVNVTIMFCEAIKQGEFETSHTDMEKLLGRKPLSLEVYFQTVYGKN